MRTWTKVAYADRCGSCGVVLETGSWMQLLQLPGVTKQKARCVECAEGKPPLDVPLLPLDIHDWDDQPAYRETP